MKDVYLYPAIFHDDESGISVAFPDLPGCYTCGNTVEQAMKSAKEALGLHLYGMERDNDPIPEPSSAGSLKPERGEFVGLVEVWMQPLRDHMQNRSVKKTLTIPAWLDEIACDRRINFSQVLQTALKEQLGIPDSRDKIHVRRIRLKKHSPSNEEAATMLQST